MDISKGINVKIEKKDTKAILSLFILNNKTATKNLNNINFAKLVKPFDNLLLAQKNLNENQNVINTEKVLQAFKANLMKEEWCDEIFTRIVYNLFVIGLKKCDDENNRCVDENNATNNNATNNNATNNNARNNNNKNTTYTNKQQTAEKSAKILQSLFKEIFDDKVNHTKTKMLPKIFNFLVCTYDSLYNYKMIDTLFSVFDTKIMFENEKDKKIYKFMLGQHYIRKEDYKNAFACFQYSFNVKNTKIQKEILPYLFFTSLFTKRYVKDEVLQRLGFDDLIFVKKVCLLGNVYEYNEIAKICATKYKKLNRCILVDLTYIVYRNLIGNLANTILQEDRIYFHDIQAYANIWSVKMELEMIVCVILNLIAKGYVKGYVSIIKSVVVLSRENMFP